MKVKDDALRLNDTRIVGSLRSNLPKGKVTDTYDAIMSGLDKLQAEYTANNAATEISA